MAYCDGDHGRFCVAVGAEKQMSRAYIKECNQYKLYSIITSLYCIVLTGK